MRISRTSSNDHDRRLISAPDFPGYARYLKLICRLFRAPSRRNHQLPFIDTVGIRRFVGIVL